MTLFVRVERGGMWSGARYGSQLSRIVFAASDPKRGFQQAQLKPHPKAGLQGWVMADFSTAVLKDFFQKKRA